jgi:hypothetical protein
MSNGDAASREGGATSSEGVEVSALELLQPTMLEGLQESLPKEIQGNMYEDEGDLWEDLEKLNLTDLHIVLNNEGYAVWREMPGPIHNAAVRGIQTNFQRWEQEQGPALFGEKGADVFYKKNFKKNNKRCSDLFCHLGSRSGG